MDPVIVESLKTTELISDNLTKNAFRSAGFRPDLQVNARAIIFGALLIRDAILRGSGDVIPEETPRGRGEPNLEAITKIQEACEKVIGASDVLHGRIVVSLSEEGGITATPEEKATA